MKITIGSGETYEVDPEVLDYMALQYGNKVLEKYDALDITAQTGIKMLAKQFVLKPFLKAFGLSSKLPRGTDPNRYLIRAYVVMLRESLNMGHLRLAVDNAGLIVNADLTYDHLEEFAPKMSVYLEELKGYAGNDGAGIRQLESDQNRARPELAVGGQEAQWQDDGRETDSGQFIPAVSLD